MFSSSSSPPFSGSFGTSLIIDFFDVVGCAAGTAVIHDDSNLIGDTLTNLYVKYEFNSDNMRLYSKELILAEGAC